MAAEVILLKCQVHPLSPLVLDALAIKARALNVVSRPSVIWPLPPPHTFISGPLKSACHTHNYFIYRLASPTSLSKYIHDTAHPGAQYIKLSE